MSDTALAVVEQGALIPAAMGDNFRRYRTLQSDIDKAMPDCIIKIQGRDFRRKNYWRAVGVAFGLRVELMREERIERGTDWGYMVVYRAIAKNGMSADGDGICMASEKRGGQASEHNVRSHGHTRAYNRAISNLVGFGEVSAEEVEREEHRSEAPVVQRLPSPRPAASDDEPPAGMFDDAQAEVIDAEPPQGFVYVKDVSEKTGESPTTGKKWTLYIVKFSDGREASTFDGPISITAKAAMASHVAVIPTLQPSGKGQGKWNLVNLLRA